MKIGIDLSQMIGGPKFDPVQNQIETSDILNELPIYDELLKRTPDGSLAPDLATSASVVNPQTVTIQLRQGVKYSDGTSLDASSVKFGLERNLSTTHHAAFHSIFFDVASIDVTAPYALTVHLNKPVAGAWYQLLGDEESFLVSPTAAQNKTADLNTAPVGAGPFLLKQNVPQQEIVYTKNPNYWDAKDIHLAGIDLINVANGPQQVNALESGTVNLAIQLPVADVGPLKANHDLVVGVQTMTGYNLHMSVCKASGPLADVRVRQALNYATDRVAINQAVLGGLGTPAWSILTPSSPLYDKSLDNYYKYDPSKAKQLLQSAGYGSGLSLTVIPLPSPINQQTAQILQEEWKQVGVTLNIRQASNYVNDIFVRKVAPLGLLNSGQATPINLVLPFLPGNFADVCDFNDPSFNNTVAEYYATPPDSPMVKSLWKSLQDQIIQNGLMFFFDNEPAVDAWAKNVHGVQFFAEIGPLPYFWSISISK